MPCRKLHNQRFSGRIEAKQHTSVELARRRRLHSEMRGNRMDIAQCPLRRGPVREDAAAEGEEKPLRRRKCVA